MGKQRALLILHPSLGHVNAFRKVIETMKVKYELAICGAAIGVIYLKQFQVKTYLLNNMPIGTGFEKYLCSSSVNKFRCELYMRKSMTLFHRRRKSYKEILNEWSPSIIFIDFLYMADILFINRYLTNSSYSIYLIRTKPALCKHRFTIPSVYRVKYINGLISEFLWLKFNISNIFRRCSDYIIFHGFDNISIIHKARDILFGSGERLISIKWMNIIGFKINNYPELVLLPSEFEFVGYKPKNTEHYLGFQYADHLLALDETMSKVLRTVEISKQNGKRVITISFGSLYIPFEGKIIKFLNKLIEALKQFTVYHCIVLIGKINLKLPPLPDNLVFTQIDELPIRRILEFSDLHITHGGINTIKDCIFSKTPMLVTPLNKHWDQPGNSAKVECHGLGISVSIDISRNKLYHELNNIFDFFNVDNFEKFIELEQTKYNITQLYDILP